MKALKVLYTIICILLAVAANAQEVRTYADAVDKASPSVVSILTSKKIPLDIHPLFQDPFFRYFFGDLDESFTGPKYEKQASLGSGVIVSQDGYILTNYHVIKDADSIKVALQDGRNVAAKIIGSDPESDLAVLKINLKKLPVINIGNSNDMRVGDVVLAIGNPFGVGQTVTQGIISAFGRHHVGLNLYENFIQTDAAINPGNSGGALINVDGNLVGINTAIYTHSGGYQGIGFAIPIEYAKMIKDQLIKNKQVIRGYLGLSVQGLNNSLRESFNYHKDYGVLVANVLPRSPAHLSGIRVGDIITKLDNKIMKNSHMMLTAVANLEPGKYYEIEYFRKGKLYTTKAQAYKKPN